jgi:hypothetical protein
VPTGGLVSITTLAGVLLLVVVWTTHVNGTAVDRWMADGSPAVATIADRTDGDYSVAVDVRVVGDSGPSIPMEAQVDYPETYDTGDRYTAVVSADGARVRLLAEPYDRTEPRAWLLVLALVPLWFLARRLIGA